MDKKFNFGVQHGRDAFYANGISVNINSEKFTLDFRQTTQRLDDFGEKVQTTLFTHHNTLILDPSIAKGLFNILKQGITNYEKKFGKIKPPKQIKEKVKEKDSLVMNPETYIG